MFRRSGKRPRVPYLFDGPHWRVGPISGLEVFFANLPRLLPRGGILCLAGSAWSKEGRAFARGSALSLEEPHPLPGDFDEAPGFAIDGESLIMLSEMATRHAEPELAVHIGVHADGVALLEWYDLPDDPISVSLSVPKERVEDFTQACGVTYEQRPGWGQTTI